MPIRRELRHLYRGPVYRAQRARIMERAGGKCEQCGKPNGRLVWVYGSKEFGQFWTRSLSRQDWVICLSAAKWPLVAGKDDILKARKSGHLRRIRVVLTKAHLDHDPTNGDDDNQAMLCQWCHLNWNKLHHKETRSARKDAARPLLAGVA